MTNVVEQICIIRAIDNSGSKTIISLEPKKVPCATCDGKCVKMLKPSELIELETDLAGLELNQEVMLYMDKTDLRRMVVRVFGAPLLLLLAIVLIGTSYDISEINLIITIAISLVVIFIFQVRYLQFSKQIKVRKLNSRNINIEK